VSTCLALVQIDHEGVVVQGLPALNHALRTGDLAPLRRLLQSLPFDEPQDLLDFLRDRLARLRQVKAPPVIIESEERRLASVRRPAPEHIEQASLEELRTLLGRWCAEARTLDLDSGWDLLHWYGDPGRRRRPIGDWRVQAGHVPPSAWDHALYGAEPYPLDAGGQPVIRTGGDPTAGWYNPPPVVARVAAALAALDTTDWDQIDAKMDGVQEDDEPYRVGVEDRLQYVRPLFEEFRDFYRAAGRGFGVSTAYY
jgi:hypothetical protein